MYVCVHVLGGYKKLFRFLCRMKFLYLKKYKVEKVTAALKRKNSFGFFPDVGLCLQSFALTGIN